MGDALSLSSREHPRGREHELTVKVLCDFIVDIHVDSLCNSSADPL